MWLWLGLEYLRGILGWQEEDKGSAVGKGARKE